MTEEGIKKLCTLEMRYTDEALVLLIDSFYFMFQGISKDREVLRRLFAPCIQRELFYVMLENGRVAGLAAVSNCSKRAIVISPEACIPIFGKVKGKLLAWQLQKILSVPEVSGNENGYIDFLATAQDDRRKGVAAGLLGFVEQDMGFRVLYLDVLVSNTAAICLYQKLGYHTETLKKSVMMRLAGVKPMYIMKKICSGTA